MQLSTTIKNARVQVLSDAIDAQDAVLRLLNAAQETVCELAFASYSAEDISSGTLTFNDLPESLVLLNDTVANAVIVDTEDAVLVTLTVGDLDSSADLKLPSLTLIQGGLLRVSGWTVSEL